MTRPSRDHCAHGARRELGICPDCANEHLSRRQRSLDRARFVEQLRRIKGEGTSYYL